MNEALAVVAVLAIGAGSVWLYVGYARRNRGEDQQGDLLPLAAVAGLVCAIVLYIGVSRTIDGEEGGLGITIFAFLLLLGLVFFAVRLMRRR